MKKNIQNVLAQNSDGTIAYICGKCSEEIDKEDTICPNCGAKLGNIRCPFCNFVGGVPDFQNDTCPRCGRKTQNANNNVNNTEKRSNKNLKPISTFNKKFFWLFFILLIVLTFGLFILFIYYFELI